MANTIQIKRSSTAGAIPEAADLAQGELAANLVDRKLYSKNADGVVFQLGGGATGAGQDDIFYENSQTVTTDYTITTGKNAMSAGPITINDGITVTVPDGSTWTVV
jgi:hypothetical protein